MPIGQGIVAFGGPANADVIFHQVVIRLNVLVRKRPVLAVAVVASSLEVQITQAITLAAPYQRAPTYDSEPLPSERFIGGVEYGFLRSSTNHS